MPPFCHRYDNRLLRSAHLRPTSWPPRHVSHNLCGWMVIEGEPTPMAECASSAGFERLPAGRRTPQHPENSRGQEQAHPDNHAALQSGKGLLRKITRLGDTRRTGGASSRRASDPGWHLGSRRQEGSRRCGYARGNLPSARAHRGRGRPSALACTAAMRRWRPGCSPGDTRWGTTQLGGDLGGGPVLHRMSGGQPDSGLTRRSAARSSPRRGGCCRAGLRPCRRSRLGRVSQEVGAG